MKSKLLLLCLLLATVPEVTSKPSPSATQNGSVAKETPSNEIPGLPPLAELLKRALPNATAGTDDTLVVSLTDPESKQVLPYGLLAMGALLLDDWLVLVVNGSIMEKDGKPDKDGFPDPVIGRLNLIWMKKQGENWEKVHHEQNIAVILYGVENVAFHTYGRKRAVVGITSDFWQWGDAWGFLELFDLLPGASVKLADSIQILNGSGGNASTPCYLKEGSWHFRAPAPSTSPDALAYPDINIIFFGAEYQQTGKYDKDCHCGDGWTRSKTLNGKATYRIKDGKYQLAEGTNLAQEPNKD